MLGGGGAAQDDRVAGLQAQSCGVDRNVRPGLVDDGDDAERDADLADVQTVGQAPPVDDLADGVGQRGDLRDGGGDRGDASEIEPQAVEEGVAQAGLVSGVHVALVGGEDLGRALDQGLGDREQRGVLDGGVGGGEHARGAARGAAEIGDRSGGGGGAHVRHRVVPSERATKRAVLDRGPRASVPSQAPSIMRSMPVPAISARPRTSRGSDHLTPSSSELSRTKLAIVPA